MISQPFLDFLSKFASLIFLLHISKNNATNLERHAVPEKDFLRFFNFKA